jgi:hypothetical protein
VSRTAFRLEGNTTASLKTTAESSAAIWSTDGPATLAMTEAGMISENDSAVSSPEQGKTP